LEVFESLAEYGLKYANLKNPGKAGIGVPQPLIFAGFRQFLSAVGTKSIPLGFSQRMKIDTFFFGMRNRVEKPATIGAKSEGRGLYSMIRPRTIRLAGIFVHFLAPVFNQII